MAAATDDDISVTVWETSTVKPSTPTPPHFLYLSGVDQLLKIVSPSRSILFYATSVDPTEAAASLRSAISTALVPFYPLAGRCFIDTDGRFTLNCNDAGVEFVQARCSLPFSAVEDSISSSGAGGRFQIRPLFRRLVPLDDRSSSNYVGDPIVSVQVTSFVGGLSVGFAISHAVADGLSFWTFVRAVSECCLGLPPSVEPLHARTLLKPDTFLLNKFADLPESDVFNTEAAPYWGSVDLSNQSPASNLMLVEAEKLRQVMVSFDREAIGKLKEECRRQSKETIFSTFHVLSAYLWKRLTKAQGLKEGMRVDLRMPLDVRRRIWPPLTAAFFGNAVVGVSVPETAGELVSESLAETAGKIKQKVLEANDSFLKRAIATRDRLDMRTLVLGNVVLCNIRNGSQFPVFQSSDFGWGQAVAVRPPWSGREGEITLYPSKTAGTVDVILGLRDATSLAFCSPSLLPDDPLSYLFSSSSSE